MFLPGYLFSASACVVQLVRHYRCIYMKTNFSYLKRFMRTKPLLSFSAALMLAALHPVDAAALSHPIFSSYEGKSHVFTTPPDVAPTDVAVILSDCEAREHCQIGFVVRDVESGKDIVSYNSGYRMIPASVVKLISTGVALQYNGPHAKFITEVDYLGDIRGGVLQGDLIIRGSGDPSFGTRYIKGERYRFFSELISSLKSAGIKKVDGRIVIDASAFAPSESAPQWLFEDLGEYYGASLYGFNIYDNIVACSVTSQSDSTYSVSYPEGVNDFFDLRLDIQPDEYKDLLVLGDPLSQTRVLHGGIPFGKSRDISISNSDPALYAAILIKKYLGENKIDVVGDPVVYYKNSPQFENSKDLFRFYSKPFSDLVKETNYRSLNLWADAFMGLLDQRLPKNMRSGLLIAQNYLTSNCDIPKEEFDLYDGCGLSPKDRITPNALAAFMSNLYNAHPDVSTAFYYSLPLAGVEGSVKSFSLKAPLSARLKSGSMEGVQSYAGFLRKAGKDFIVVMMANGFVSRQAIRKSFKEALEKAVE